VEILLFKNELFFEKKKKNNTVSFICGTINKRILFFFLAEKSNLMNFLFEFNNIKHSFVLFTYFTLIIIKQNQLFIANIIMNLTFFNNQSIFI